MILGLGGRSAIKSGKARPRPTLGEDWLLCSVCSACAALSVDFVGRWKSPVDRRLGVLILKPRSPKQFFGL